MVIQHFFFTSADTVSRPNQFRRIAKVDPKNQMLPLIGNKLQQVAVWYLKDLTESFVASIPSKQGKWQVLEEAHGEATMVLRTAL